MNSTLRRAGTLAVALIFYGSAHAGTHGLQLTVIGLPSARQDNSTFNSPNTAVGKDSAREVTVMYHYLSNHKRRVAFSIGAGLDFISIDGVEGENMVGWRVEPGAAFNISKHFRLETVYSLAYGRNSKSFWTQTGALVRPVYIFDGGASVHAQLGYINQSDQFWSNRPERSGLTIGMGMGVQFQ